MTSNKKLGNNYPIKKEHNQDELKIFSKIFNQKILWKRIILTCVVINAIWMALSMLGYM